MHYRMGLIYRKFIFCAISLPYLYQICTSFQVREYHHRLSRPRVHNNLRFKETFTALSRVGNQKLSNEFGFDENESSVEACESTDQAKAFLRKAQELREEARLLEKELELRRKSKLEKEEADFEALLDRLFPCNIYEKFPTFSAQSVAKRLRDERMSEDDVVSLLEEIYKRRKQLVDATELSRITLATSKIVTANESAQVNKYYQQSAINQTLFDRYSLYLQYLSDAASVLDDQAKSSSSTLSSRRWTGQGSKIIDSKMKEWRRAEEIEFQRRISLETQSANNEPNLNTTMQEFITKSLGIGGTLSRDSFQPSLNMPVTTNASFAFEHISLIPMWVPSSLLGLVASSKSVFGTLDVREIKEKVLSKSSFFCTSSDSIACAAIFRGNIRSSSVASNRKLSEKQAAANHTESVFREIQDGLEKEGLSERIQLFLIEDPEWRVDKDIGSNFRGPRPVILALPKTINPQATQTNQTYASIAIKQLVVALSLLTTFAYSASCYSLNPVWFDSIVKNRDLAVITWCFPIFMGLFAVQLVHEVAHWSVARRRGIRIGWPMPLPSTALGLFGSITPLQSFPPNRSALLDFALSGPLAGMIVSIMFMVVGSIKTAYATQAALLRFPVIPVIFLKSSFLAGSILSYLLPKAMLLPQSQPIPIHPLFLIGFSGSLSSALNLLPIFRLDGGRACTAAVGHRISELTSAWALLFLLSLGLSGSKIAWAWGGLVLLFQRRSELPSRDEVTKISDSRLAAWIGSIAAAVLALAPFPGGLGML